MPDNKTPEQMALEQQEAMFKETPEAKLLEHRNQILAFKDSPAYRAIWDYLMSFRVQCFEQLSKTSFTVHPDIKAAIDNHNRGVISGLDKFFEIVPQLQAVAAAEGEDK